MEAASFLSVSLVQFNIAWEQPDLNLARLDKLLMGIDKNTNLVILPEMFNTGFSMKAAELAEDYSGATINWMVRKAASSSAVFIGSIIFHEGAKYFNRLIAVFPDGELMYYDKRHLFRLGEENKFFAAGEKNLLFTWKGWRISPLICYDLRFPVWSRNCTDYDLLIYIANWPAPRIDTWKTLLKARAIENQAYVAGVNRTGTDGQNIRYNGESIIFDPKGYPIVKSIKGLEMICNVRLSYSSMTRFRKKFPVLLDREKFTIKNRNNSD